MSRATWSLVVWHTFKFCTLMIKRFFIVEPVYRMAGERNGSDVGSDLTLMLTLALGRTCVYIEARRFFLFISRNKFHAQGAWPWHNIFVCPLCLPCVYPALDWWGKTFQLRRYKLRASSHLPSVGLAAERSEQHCVESPESTLLYTWLFGTTILFLVKDEVLRS